VFSAKHTIIQILNKNELLDAAQRIKDGLIQSISIDNFIDIHQVNESVVFCGKLAIIKTILDAEKNSPLYFDRSRLKPTFSRNCTFSIVTLFV